MEYNQYNNTKCFPLEVWNAFSTHSDDMFLNIGVYFNQGRLNQSKVR